MAAYAPSPSSRRALSSPVVPFSATSPRRPWPSRPAPACSAASSRSSVLAAETSTASPDASWNVQRPTGPDGRPTAKRTVVSAPVRPTASRARTDSSAVPDASGTTDTVAVAPSTSLQPLSDASLYR